MSPTPNPTTSTCSNGKWLLLHGMGGPLVVGVGVVVAPTLSLERVLLSESCDSGALVVGPTPLVFGRMPAPTTSACLHRIRQGGPAPTLERVLLTDNTCGWSGCCSRNWHRWSNLSTGVGVVVNGVGGIRHRCGGSHSLERSPHTVLLLESVHLHRLSTTSGCCRPTTTPTPTERFGVGGALVVGVGVVVGFGVGGALVAGVGVVVGFGVGGALVVGVGVVVNNSPTGSACRWSGCCCRNRCRWSACRWSTFLLKSV